MRSVEVEAVRGISFAIEERRAVRPARPRRCRRWSSQRDPRSRLTRKKLAQPVDDGCPGGIRLLDHVEVVGCGKLDEIDRVARRSRCCCVGPALARRHEVVARAMDEQLRDAERQQRRRGGDGISLRDIVGLTAEERLAGTAAEARRGAGDEVADARLGDGAARPQPRIGAGCARGEPVPRRRARARGARPPSGRR